MKVPAAVPGWDAAEWCGCAAVDTLTLPAAASVPAQCPLSQWWYRLLTSILIRGLSCQRWSWFYLFFAETTDFSIEC